MDRLGYTAMTAASRTMMALQVRANNLANVNTPGFRADLERAEAVAVEGYGYDSRHMAVVENNGVSLAGGALVATGRELDFAVKGSGLIVVEDGAGEAYTRQGNLQIDAEGRLTLNGRAVLGEGGPIVLPEHDKLEIGNDGTVSIMAPGDWVMAEVDRIRLVDVPAANLTKNQAGLLVTRDGQPAAPSEEVRLASGFLESSNVSAIDELASTMSLNRLFETQVKMMKAAEDLSEAGNRMIRGS
ncbi:MULTISPECIES: flagellar basal body rod protein FlgF [Pseudomonadaceae]|jgi:flagellar basal-body rod protein FlgF|uniref:flagellar basal body rod protein FlgF n=1 Tax=Pseudomonadaceae TaxID=135621 RepID=UPI000773641F|nr:MULTISPECIES: flagellar basal body rod protein FlgF [Pseudomonadaceae]MCF7200625.1 flagellar basal body rod protein FlgF [Pseudomonas oligotrophica]OMG62599.1 flagellar biosynthesis protein FlgF [Stutzerimonas balearica]